MQLPDYSLESKLRSLNYRLVAGIDEVGMGCLAGPVIAAAVILDPLKIPEGIDDSKRLTAKKREPLSSEIQEWAMAWAIGIAEVNEIDTINIYHAGRLAMLRAVNNLKIRPDHLLIDGRVKLDTNIPQSSLIQGDRFSVSIAAASVTAKVYRDKMMEALDGKYPGYGFASNKGYGSMAHRKFLGTHGPSPIHRKTFSWTPV